jgi:hypothetical protein
VGLGSVIDITGLTMLVARLGLDLIFTVIVVHVVYVRAHGRRDHILTCYSFNVVTLCLCVLLRKGQTELGFALTLFGVFGILRYRTEQIRSRDLTYLFMVLGLAIVNGIADQSLSLAELVATNAAIAGAALLLERPRGGMREQSAPLLYDRLELLRPSTREALVADIAARTGLPIVRVETERIDLLRDSADLIVFFRPE